MFLFIKLLKSGPSINYFDYMKFQSFVFKFPAIIVSSSSCGSIKKNLYEFTLPIVKLSDLYLPRSRSAWYVTSVGKSTYKCSTVVVVNG